MATRFRLNFEAILGTSLTAVANGEIEFDLTQTSTLADIWADDALSVPRTNPVTLDSAGQHPDIFLDAIDYRIIIRDSSGATIAGGDIDPFHGGLSAAVPDASDLLVTATGGSSSQTLAKRFGQAVNLMDYMDDDQVADAEAGTKLLDCSAALMAVIATGRRRAKAPYATYRIAANVPLDQYGFVLEGDGEYGTIFAVDPGIDFLTIGKNGPVQGGFLKDFCVDGNGSTANGLVLGSSTANYCADWRAEKLRIINFSGTGGAAVKIVCAQQFHQHDCGWIGNDHAIHRPDLDPLSAGFMTTYAITGMNTRLDRSGSTAIYCPGQVGTITMENGSIAENGDGAVHMGAPSYTSVSSALKLIRVYTEFNNANDGGVPEIKIVGVPSGYAETALTMTDCELHAQAHSVNQFDLDRVSGRVVECNGLDYTKIAATNYSFVDFNFNTGMQGNAADVFAQAVALGRAHTSLTIRDRSYQGDIFEVRAGRVYAMATAAPSSGTVVVGDTYFNKTPAAAGVYAWAGTTAGTIGSGGVLKSIAVAA